MRRLFHIHSLYNLSIVCFVVDQIADSILPFGFATCQVFGLEYDLDLFNIVVVPDFNM
jgi:hypothetical protein